MCAMVSSKIFRSRWSALIWSAGILWTAYDVASGATQGQAKPSAASQNADVANEVDAMGSGYTQADLNTIASAIGN
jgi:hypothetical protein